jgi:PBP1b-binding outer membrane lipoprotein LpoB
MQKLLTPAALLLAALLLPGCVAAIGNRDNQPAARSNATLGQQLMDLQKARDTGAMTQAEYDTERARLMNQK